MSALETDDRFWKCGVSAAPGVDDLRAREAEPPRDLSRANEILDVHPSTHVLS